MAFKKLKRIGVLSMAKTQGVMMGMVGLLLGIFIYWIQTLITGSVSAEAPEAQIATAFGPMLILFFPIAYGILGFAMGAIVSFLYNLVARWIGGIEVEFKD